MPSFTRREGEYHQNAMKAYTKATIHLIVKRVAAVPEDAREGTAITLMLPPVVTSTVTRLHLFAGSRFVRVAVSWTPDRVSMLLKNDVVFQPAGPCFAKNGNITCERKALAADGV